MTIQEMMMSEMEKRRGSDEICKELLEKDERVLSEYMFVLGAITEDFIESNFDFLMAHALMQWESVDFEEDEDGYTEDDDVIGLMEKDMVG